MMWTSCRIQYHFISCFKNSNSLKSNSQGIRLGHNFNDRDNQNKILSEELETTLIDQKIELATK